ncbi:MAG: 3-hydroxybutyryl-CoA dehydrogenase [Candidatus Undinarchaeales archaeon]|jgi:3-hydroxybutyryl-CoA dehydrogenase|nr:3-hydroxybutyryl-CoA dehydrogenase [Candidatus Undinarchaeales archaeon]MDP7491996.1 3-hydroxybutyryl-CoA dehydrogenase [Candidatus Undinarchaeales archaeon]
MEMNEVSVIGAGTMGHGIAQVIAQAGYNVVLIDTTEDFVQAGIGRITKNLKRRVDKGKMAPEKMDEVMGRIKGSVDISDASGSQLVVEAVVENPAVKKEIFSKLSNVTNKNTILATNTSSIPITEIASSALHPERVVGMHFFNPVPVMKLVEVVRGEATEDWVVDEVIKVVENMNKGPVEVLDFPGFISNRLLMPMINEAAFALMEGAAKKEAIDSVMKLGMNHPMGPLELADLIGLDVCLSIMEVLQNGFGDPKYRPCPLLRKMVAAGYLGRKTKRGFYEYE